MFGLGHGGLESIVVVGGPIVLMLLNIAILSAIKVNSLPTAPRQVVLQQFAAINAQPFWVPLLPAWGRLWTVPLQIAESVIVLQVFRRHQMVWLFLAILSHALIDFLSAALRQVLGETIPFALLNAGMVCVFGLISVWVIWRLREPETRPLQQLISPPEKHAG